MNDATVFVPVNPDGTVCQGFGRAAQGATARLRDGRVESWTVHRLDWDTLHDAGGEGSHHARIVRFLRDEGVTHVVAGHMGPPMQNTIGKLGLTLVLGADGDAREAALRAAE